MPRLPASADAPDRLAGPLSVAIPDRPPVMPDGKAEGLRAYLRCIRYKEVLVLQGSPLFGACFGLDGLGPATIASLTVFTLASTLLVAHIFTLNDWAGIAADVRDPNKSAGVFLIHGVTRREVAALSIGLLGASLALFALLPTRTLGLAVAVAALGVLYSHPATNAKGIPVLSSAPHLLGGLLHFLLGYSLFRPVDRRGMLIALFFAITFTAGHLNQEVRDYEGDRLNGLLTNAVAFGKRAAFLAGLLGFTLAYGHLVVLARLGLVSAALGVLPLLLYPVHVFWSVSTLRSGLTFDSVSCFQRRYRMLYGLIGVAMLVTALRGG